jgi:hypothetical protein
MASIRGERRVADGQYYCGGSFLAAGGFCVGRGEKSARELARG